MRNILLLGVSILFAFLSCSSNHTDEYVSILPEPSPCSGPSGVSSIINTLGVVDTGATDETKKLYAHLYLLGNNKKQLFGHQYDQAVGVGWKYIEDRSDVKELVGEYPAMSGWDIGNLEKDMTYNMDGINFNKTRDYVKMTYRQGGVNTFSWHMNNPVDPNQPSKSTLDSTIYRLFNDQDALIRYNSWLDKAAVYFKSLRGDSGELIPILFRPFHELTGSWFWWGKAHCTPQEYIAIWRYTVGYLKDTAQVHNLLYVYCTDKFETEEEYMERYPGDEYVDILAFDFYDKASFTGNSFVVQGQKMAGIVSRLARDKNKVSGFSETGYRLVPKADWWTNSLYPIISNTTLSYVLVWSNSNENTYWCAYPGQISAPDFINFYQSDNILFENDAAKGCLYY